MTSTPGMFRPRDERLVRAGATIRTRPSDDEGIEDAMMSRVFGS